MIKQRIITAIVLLVVVLSALFSSNPIYWQALMAIVAVVGLWEWLRLSEIKSQVTQVVAYLSLIVLSFLLYQDFIPIKLTIFASVILWIGLISVSLTEKPSYFLQPHIKLVTGVWLLASSTWFLSKLHNLQSGYQWILLFLLVIWCADIGAYFVGRKFGKHKLAEKVSPGKTIEGVLGGLTLVILVLIPVLINYFPEHKIVFLFPALIVVALVSVMGDLYESKLKRIAGIKDSSQILPGHGGILDRIDSVLSGLPFYMAGLLLAGVI